MHRMQTHSVTWSHLKRWRKLNGHRYRLLLECEVLFQFKNVKCPSYYAKSSIKTLTQLTKRAVQQFIGLIALFIGQCSGGRRTKGLHLREAKFFHLKMCPSYFASVFCQVSAQSPLRFHRLLVVLAHCEWLVSVDSLSCKQNVLLMRHTAYYPKMKT